MACHLVEGVAPPEGLDAAVEDWAGAILKAGPDAIRTQKEPIRDWERLPMRFSKEYARSRLRMVRMKRSG